MKAVPWGLGAEDFRRLLGELRFRYHKWDVHACGHCLVLPEAIVLSPAEHERVVTTVERFAAILRRIEERLARNRAELTMLGIPAEVHELIEREPDATLQLARYDLFPDPEGRWWISEFNEDVPGGFNEAVGVPDLLGWRLAAGQFKGDLRRALQEAFAGAAKVALFHATGYSEDLQHMLVVRDWLRDAGTEGVLCSPAHLRWSWGRPSVLGQCVSMGFRFYPGEWFRWLSNRGDWKRAAPQLPTMNPIRRLIRQSKKLFIRWAAGDLLSGDDKAFVEAHTPVSYAFEPERLSGWRKEKDRWVLKEAFGRMGDSVVIGALATESEWIQALAEAARRPADFLIQERFQVAPLQIRGQPMAPALGAFLVNGRFAGYYSRAATRPLLTHEAYHVATIVEDA
jgi:hypothetical protein